MTLPTKLGIEPNRADTVLLLGLPSNLEREFGKILYAKGVSELIKKKKIDYCILFAVSKDRAKELMEEVLPHLKENCVFWVAFPKKASKIRTNLDCHSDWYFTQDAGYYKVMRVVLDSVWESLRFMKIDNQKLNLCEVAIKKINLSKYLDQDGHIQTLHHDLEKAFEEYADAYEFFKSLPIHCRKVYLSWIHSVEQDIVLQKRIADAIELLQRGVINPFFSP